MMSDRIHALLWTLWVDQQVFSLAKTGQETTVV